VTFASGLTEPFAKALRAVVAATVFLLPLLCIPASYDAFRYPKELLFRGVAIVIVAIFAIAAVWKGIRWNAIVRHRAVGILALAIAIWVIVTTALSTNRLLSVHALEYTFEALIFFAGAWVATAGLTMRRLVAPAAAAGVVNALLAISQATAFWNPFSFAADVPAHIATSALLGNPNDVGAYLMLVSIVVTSVAIVSKQWLWRVVLAILIAGLLATQSFAAIGGYIAGLLVIAFLASRRAGWIVVAATLLAILIPFAVVPPLRGRVALITDAVSRGDWPTATSSRIYPFLAASGMFRDHPLTGVGPGAFKFHFLDYRMKVNEHHPSWFSFSAQNFGEVHNDHMQALAEQGAPGWLLLMAAIVLLARATARNTQPDDERHSFIHYTAAPLATAFAVLALGSFPLEMVAVLLMLIYFSAAILNWSAQS
jgi:O-antigen ligase